MSLKIWYHQDQEQTELESVHKSENCLFCHGSLQRDAEAQHELQDGYGYHVLGPAIGYSGIYRSASVAICKVCGWWKYTQWMNMPGASGFEDFYNGGYGILKRLDLSDLRQPLNEVRSYLAAKYDERFRIHPRLLEQVVGSVFNSLGYKSRVTSFSGDDGIDVILDGPANELIGVQVKRYGDRIGVNQIRELTGALFIGGYTRGIFVTTSSFQSGGKRTADMSTRRGIPVELMDAERFYSALQIAQINAYTDKGVERPWASLAARAISR